jgi:hypothetical protein
VMRSQEYYQLLFLLRSKQMGWDADSRHRSTGWLCPRLSPIAAEHFPGFFFFRD